jgi:hypothetical protein
MVCGKDIEMKGTTRINGVLDMTDGGTIKIDGTTEFEELSVDTVTATQDVTVSGTLTASGDLLAADASVSGDMSVVGDASVGGDLNVVGALNAALQVPVHIVSDPTRRTIQAANMPVVLDASNYSALLQSKQPLIETTATGFKIKESGLYLFYFRYHCFASNMNYAKTRFFKNGSEIHVNNAQGVTTGNNDIYANTVFFDNAAVNDLITVDFVAGNNNSYVTTVMTYVPALQALFGAIKLA